MNKGNATKSKHPEWCIDEHDDLNPVEDGICYGEQVKLEDVLSRDVGDGVTDAMIRRSLTPSGADGIDVDIRIETSVSLADVETVATELEKLAAAVREFTAQIN